MYSYEWDPKTRGYLLTTQASKFVANEIRPVFAEELTLTGMDRRFAFNPEEKRPFLWAKKNLYFYKGEKIAQTRGVQYGKPIEVEYFFEKKKKLQPVDVDEMVRKNAKMTTLVVADAKRRVKEQYDATIKQSDVAYIAFSGGKDSVVLLDLCHQVLPISVPVIYSDTDMELPDSVDYVWPEVQKRYPEREFIKVKARSSALENWRVFGPPSRTVRWCCSVHKSTPAIMYLKKRLNSDSVKATAFLGVRSEESLSRANYDDISYAVKNASQTNCMPILEWGAHELWLYIFANELTINPVYRHGLTRVGCVMCPESSEKYVWFVDKLYPNELKKFNEVILKTSNKEFETEKDRTEFIGSLNWQARKSGITLKEQLRLPIESSSGTTTTFKSESIKIRNFFEWIKTLGGIRKASLDRENSDSLKYFLSVPLTIEGTIRDSEEIAFVYKRLGADGGKVSFTFPDFRTQSLLLPILRSFFKKVVSCVNCRSCEAECVLGAISSGHRGIEIDANKCIHCRMCYDICNSCSCWRFKSMVVSQTEQSDRVGINSYTNFGLRENANDGWISALVELGEDFFPWTPLHSLGKKMVPAARLWFAQAELIDSSRKPKKLVELFREKGTDSVLGWELIWFALANNALLIKWFVTDVEFGKSFTQDELTAKLSNYFPAFGPSTIAGGFSALKDTLSKSPLGMAASESEIALQASDFTDDANVALLLYKGKTIKTITRRPKNIKPLTLLYSLYFIARDTNRSAFTVREMMESGKDSPFISPITAFGLSPETFTQQCEGLRSRYPDFISTVFTHGNDEFEVYPERHTLDDIITLCILEN
jgi:phosphoadenosine phosphosulfate reductase